MSHSTEYRDLDWSVYAPGTSIRVRGALQRARRVIKACKLCGKPAASWHVHLEAAAQTLGGTDRPIRSYGLCRHHTTAATIEQVEAALGLRPTTESEVIHATD